MRPQRRGQDHLAEEAPALREAEKGEPVPPGADEAALVAVVGEEAPGLGEDDGGEHVGCELGDLVAQYDRFASFNGLVLVGEELPDKVVHPRLPVLLNQADAPWRPADGLAQLLVLLAVGDLED